MAVAKPKDKPIIFGAESIRAILTSKKSQTRRVIKGVPENARHGEFAAPFGEEHRGWAGGVFFEGANVNSRGVGSIRCPYGKPGDRLWVKETFIPDPPQDGTWDDACGEFLLSWIPDKYRQTKYVLYKADPKWSDEPFTWTSPLFMPRWASRLTLTITDVRVERLQDISEEDAVAEGCVAYEEKPAKPWMREATYRVARLPRAQFMAHWDDLNARRGYPWESNPFCWVVSFQVVS